MSPQRPQVNWLLGYPGATVLVFIYAALALSAASHKSCHFDENLHIISGYSYWLTNDYRLQPENGNWPQRWVTLPYLITRPQFPSIDQEDYYLSKPSSLAQPFLFVDNDADQLLMQSRAMVVLLAMGLGLLVYGWSRRLFGPAGGMISLCLYVLSPTVLANGAIATSDLAASLFFLASTYCLWELLREVSVRSLLLSCAAMTGLFLSKFSAGLIVPIGLLLVLIRVLHGPLKICWRGQARDVAGPVRAAGLLSGLVAVHVLCVATAIWASFGFRYAMFANDDPRNRPGPEWAEVLALDSPLPLKVIQWCRTHEVLPESYLYGLAHTLHFARYRPAFLHERIRMFGWPEFFPLTFLWKTPLPVFLFMILALLAVVFCRHALPVPLFELAPPLVLFAVYWVVALFAHLNIGHRHILPTYPPLFVLCGAAGLWFRSPGRPLLAMRAAACLGIVLLAGEALYFYPHYLCYFNQIVGGPSEGYQYLVDSSYDWGQELKGLKRWLDENPTPEPKYHFYFGPSGHDYYRLPTREIDLLTYDHSQLLTEQLKPGLYCVGATFLQNVYSFRMGHWNPQYEEEYHICLRYFAEKAHADPKNHRTVVATMNYLAFGRLTSYLRCRKQPIAQVGYSVLVYRLTADDLQRALLGPAWEHASNIDDGYVPPRFHVNDRGEVVERLP
jgi:hypothetical protein